MPAQKLDKQHSLKILNMEPTGVSTNSHQQLMSDCDTGEINCSEVENDNGLRMRDIPKMKWFTVIILCYVNLINYMDRFTLAGVLTEIQSYFSIGDSSGGLLQTAFVLSYMLFAPLFGYLGDRYNRRYIMAFGVFLWSLTTLIGSFMESFTGFIIFRALVGIGEASYSTIAPTIISDLFIKDVRSKMLALFYFAIPVGSGLGYIVGSETSRAAGKWQWGLRVTPSLGALAVVLILFVMLDPTRGEDETEGSQHFETTSWWTDIKELSQNASFMLSTAGFTCVAFVAGALAWWGPTFIYQGLKLQEQNDVSLNDVSYVFGIIAMASGIIGVPLGSFIAQRLRPRYNSQADPIICAIGLLISAPFVYFALLAAKYHTILCYTFVFFAELTLNLNWSIVADMLLVSLKTVSKMVLVFSLSFLFGLITMLAGIAGLSLGTFLSSTLKRRFPRADPIICALGLFISAPLLTGCTFAVTQNTTVCFVLLFFGQVALNLNWAIVADILLYVVIPTRRSTAEAFQILISHTFGDAGSPFLIGLISEALFASFQLSHSSGSAIAETIAVNRTVVRDLTADEDKFKSLQYALFTTSFVEVLGGFFFLCTALYVLRDKMLVDQAVSGDSGQPKNIYADDPLTEIDQRRNLVS